MATKTIASIQKDCVSEALKRRFAVAEAEARPQPIRNKRKYEELDQGLKSATVGLAPTLRYSSASARSSAVNKDLEAVDLTYSRLSQSIHENLVSSTELSDKGKNTVDGILHEFLRKGDSAQKYMQGSRSVKVDHWLQLDNVSQRCSTSTAQSQALREKSKRSRIRMSMKQLKKHGFLTLPEEFRKFENFMPMHELWKDYVLKFLKNVGKDQVAQFLLGADLHGAILRVVECKVDSHIGVTGIMFRETAETFGIITQDDDVRVVPKRNSVFMLQADCWKITILGDKYISRMRAS